MSASSVQINSTGGTRMATNSYTEGAVTVHDEKTILGEPYLPTYTFNATVALVTANSHLAQIMASSSLKVYIKQITIDGFAPFTTATVHRIGVYRLTTAGTGGASITPSVHNTADAGSGATAMTLPTAKGTEGAVIKLAALPVTTAAPMTGRWTWEATSRSQAIIIPTGTTNGIALKNLAADASGSVVINIEFIEASF